MKNNPNLLTYFLANALFLGGGLSMIFSLANHDTYISAFLGIVIGIGIIFILNKINNDINQPLKDYLKKKSVGNIIIKIIYFLYLISLIFILLIDLSTFLYSYFLPFTPSIVSCLPFIFLATYLGCKSIKNIYYMGVALIPISIIIIILKTALLAGEIDFANILPIMASKTTSIFKGAVIYAILSTTPFLLLMGSDITFKKSVKYYLLSCLLNLVVIFTVTGILGGMVNIFSYPEYSVLRKIKILDFIENIENFISISWFFDIYITLSLIGLKIKECLNTKNNIYPFIITSLVFYLIYKFISQSSYNSMVIYNIYIYVFGIILFLLITLLFINNKAYKKQH